MLRKKKNMEGEKIQENCRPILSKNTKKVHNYSSSCLRMRISKYMDKILSFESELLLVPVYKYTA